MTIYHCHSTGFNSSECHSSESHSAECHGAELGAVFKVDAEIKINDLRNNSIIHSTFVNSFFWFKRVLDRGPE